jgi:hypothetical protein
VLKRKFRANCGLRSLRVRKDGEMREELKCTSDYYTDRIDIALKSPQSLLIPAEYLELATTVLRMLGSYWLIDGERALH